MVANNERPTSLHYRWRNRAGCLLPARRAGDKVSRRKKSLKAYGYHTDWLYVIESYFLVVASVAIIGFFYLVSQGVIG